MPFCFNRCVTVALVVLSSFTATSAQTLPAQIHLIWMGGNDCPPCVAWRASELPKLQMSPVFQQIKFSFVIKSVGSSVPPSLFLDSDVRPYKEKLDYASAGRAGSPQGALIVNGEVFDYFVGARSAQEIEGMISAVLTGSTYPVARCIRVVGSRNVRRCEIGAS
jgi:hypothetical protein